MELLRWEVRKGLFNGGLQELEIQQLSFFVGQVLMTLDFIKITCIQLHKM